jgi:hypothetical protein
LLIKYSAKSGTFLPQRFNGNKTPGFIKGAQTGNPLKDAADKMLLVKKKKLDIPVCWAGTMNVSRITR